MKKIIFLDIDGVLNVIPQGRDEYGDIYHPEFVENLRWIIEQTGAEIVLSTSGRFDDDMLEKWFVRDYPGKIVGITPHIAICQRGKEIQKWLDENPVDTYCIIDDDTDMLPSQMNNFVKTSENQDHPDCVDIGYGLTRKCAEKVINILNNKN